MLNYDRSHMSNLQGPAGTIPTQSRTFLSLKGYTTQYCPERMLSLEIILCSLSTLMPLIPQSFADIFITVVIRGVSVLCMPGMFPLQHPLHSFYCHRDLPTQTRKKLLLFHFKKCHGVVNKQEIKHCSHLSISTIIFLSWFGVTS